MRLHSVPLCCQNKDKFATESDKLTSIFETVFPKDIIDNIKKFLSYKFTGIIKPKSVGIYRDLYRIRIIPGYYEHQVLLKYWNIIKINITIDSTQNYTIENIKKSKAIDIIFNTKINIYNNPINMNQIIMLIDIDMYYLKL